MVAVDRGKRFWRVGLDYEWIAAGQVAGLFIRGSGAGVVRLVMVLGGL